MSAHIFSLLPYIIVIRRVWVSVCFIFMYLVAEARSASSGSSLCFGGRVSVMFHFMFVHYTFSSVLVPEWPPFGK